MSFLIPGENNAIKTYLRNGITQQNSQCWLLGDRDETANYNMSELNENLSNQMLPINHLRLLHKQTTQFTPEQQTLC